jgi:hypothetical protein
MDCKNTVFFISLEQGEEKISRFGCQLSAVSYQLDSNAADC